MGNFEINCQGNCRKFWNCPSRTITNSAFKIFKNKWKMSNSKNCPNQTWLQEETIEKYSGKKWPSKNLLNQKSLLRSLQSSCGIPAKGLVFCTFVCAQVAISIRKLLHM